MAPISGESHPVDILGDHEQPQAAPVITWKISLSFVAVALFLPPILFVLAWPVLIVSLIVTRILQLIRKGDGYFKATQLMLLLEGLIYLWTVAMLPAMGISYLIVKHVHGHNFELSSPAFKHLMIGSLSINWITITCMIFGFYILSYLLSSIPLHIFRPLPLEHNESGINVGAAVSEIVKCVVFLWAESEVKKRVPIFKQHQILGLHTWKWIQVFTFVLIGYDTVTIFTHLIAFMLRKTCQMFPPGDEPQLRSHFIMEKVMNREYLVYCANGIKSSINFVLSSILLLLTWVLYFGSNLKFTGTPRAKKGILDFGTWTLLSLLILAFLWLINTFLVLMWNANNVYNRLRNQIIETRKHLYFLGIIGRHKYDLFSLRYSGSSEDYIDIIRSLSSVKIILLPLANIKNHMHRNDKDDAPLGKNPTGAANKVDASLGKNPTGAANKVDAPLGKNPTGAAKKLSATMWKRVKDDFSMDKYEKYNSTMYDVHQMAQYFLDAKQALSKETYASDVLNYITVNNNSSTARNTSDDHDRNASTCSGLELQKKRKNSDLQKNLKLLINGLDTAKEDSSDAFSNCLNFLKLKLKEDSSGDLNNSPELKEDSSDDLNFLKLLEISSWKDISIDNVRYWLESALDKCLYLANTLSSAKEVVDCLNQVISILLVGATFIMWLLLTGLATTKVLVLIASPLLAASFMFGETCKNLFHGIMFVCVLHPFNIGDVCSIEDKTLEVRSIGVWKTTFLTVSTPDKGISTREEVISTRDKGISTRDKGISTPDKGISTRDEGISNPDKGISTPDKVISTREEVIYPTLQLADKMVIKNEFDWNDKIVLNLDWFLDNEKACRIKHHIERLLDYGEEKFTPRSYSIKVQTGHLNQIVVTFKHKKPIQQGTYFERLKQKHKLRSEISDHIWNIVNEVKKEKKNVTSSAT